ncbi:methyltransferase domain-containing protein [Lipomyces arxii]|uniref:methyltransferase domain-containing protein n=1 Tax=Lipomyces arxii TaxID=56418 RepID=UPI0034CF4757
MTNSFPVPTGFSSVDDYLKDLDLFYKTDLVQILASEIHILRFFLEDPDLFEQTLPNDWADFFDHADLDNAVNYLILGKHDSLTPPESLAKFVSSVHALSIDRTLPKNSVKKADILRSTALSVGMSPKKLHECQHASPAIATVCNQTLSPHVIDLGSGKGYLSRTLAYEYNCAVVALENVGSRKEGAERLDDLFDRKGGKREATGSLIHIEKNVDSGDLGDVVSKAHLSGEKIVLAGLHTCGNLAHHAIRSLVHTEEIHGVAVVGCCYNLMTEKAIDHDNVGYPMSQKLESLRIPLSTYARMTACQAPTTWTKETREDFFTRHFYRALLQKIFKDRELLQNQDKLIIGSLRKQWYKSFPLYCQGACKRASSESITKSSPFYISEQVAQDYYNKYEHKRKRLCILWTLMASTVAPLTEALIHLDRYYYLVEHDAEAHVLVVFDHNISARNLMVVGIK